MTISTHVLDAVAGRPATGVPVRLERRDGQRWQELAQHRTDADGRVPDLAGPVTAGVYRLTFDVEEHLGSDAFYPEVTVVFRVRDADGHDHVPLLLSPFAYSTYRGS